MNVLSLFAERAGMNVVGQVEIDPFCRQVSEFTPAYVRRLADLYLIPEEVQR